MTLPATGSGVFDPAVFFEERELLRGKKLTAARLVAMAQAGFSSLGVAGALTGWGSPKVVFRGHLDASWGLTPTLVRAVTEGKIATATEAQLCDAERSILKGAQTHRAGALSGGWLGKNMTDGELLAVLQHQEAPTRFLDVTEDPLVALYFAAELEDTTDGRLFLIGLNPRTGMGKTTDAASPQGLELDLAGVNRSTRGGLPWPATTTRQNASATWTNAIYLVDAGSLDPRMRAQKGKFIVGGLARAYREYTVNSAALGRALTAEEVLSVTSFGIGFRRTTHRQGAIGRGVDAYAWSLRVPGDLKPEIRHELTKLGIHRDSLFPEYREFKRLAHHLAHGGR